MDKNIDLEYLAKQIRDRINSLNSEFYKHHMQINYSEEEYDHQERGETEDWIHQTIQRIYLLILTYLEMKNLPILSDEFRKRYSEKLLDKSFMIESAGLPFDNDFEHLTRITEFEDFLLPFQEFDVFRNNKGISSNILETILINTNTIINQTKTIIRGETSVYNSVKWFLELVWPESRVEKLPEFTKKFKKYRPDLHVPELEVAIEYKLIRQKSNPEDHIDDIRTDSINYTKIREYSTFYAVMYFIGKHSHKKQSIRQCWDSKGFPPNWKLIIVNA